MRWSKSNVNVSGLPDALESCWNCGLFHPFVGANDCFAETATKLIDEKPESKSIKYASEPASHQLDHGILISMIDVSAA